MLTVCAFGEALFLPFKAMELHFKLVGLAPPCGSLASFKPESHCQVPVATTLEKENATTVNAYRYASDINLPWRIYATLRWALVSCVRRFGDHLRYDRLALVNK